MTELYLNDLITSFSSALDYVEREVVGVTVHHAKRVAYLSVQMGRTMNYGSGHLANLAASAALHDNALSEYIQYKNQDGGSLNISEIGDALGIHCTMGEKNISQMPFYPDVRDAILYHHERADGNGPFGKRPEEISDFARLIHLADTIDARFDLSTLDDERFGRLCDYLKEQRDVIFDSEMTDVFLHTFPTMESASLHLEKLDQLTQEVLPPVKVSYTATELIRTSFIFSKIIDYKSSFTCRHSQGIAEKAMRMGAYYGWDEDVQAQLYLAGALHDVGKLMVDNDILEKPGRLTAAEYRSIQDHAYGSYVILHNIRGLEEVAAWAYLHHEKLDGSGYPFGKKAEDLGHKERLMACLDIYQALVEERPYKEGLAHREAITILNNLAEKGQIDGEIVRDIDRCFSAGQSAGV